MHFALQLMSFAFKMTDFTTRKAVPERGDERSSRVPERVSIEPAPNTLPVLFRRPDMREQLPYVSEVEDLQRNRRPHPREKLTKRPAPRAGAPSDQERIDPERFII